VHVEDELAPYVELSQQLSMTVGDTEEDYGVPSVTIIEIHPRIFHNKYISHIMLHIKKIINVVTEFEKNILCSHTSISIKPFNQVNSKN